MLKTLHPYLFAGLALLPLLFTACADDDQAEGPSSVSTGYLVSADALVVEAGKAIAYRDASVGAASWSWDFEGGEPQRAFDPSPRAVYPEAGTFITTLITTFNDGSRRRFSLRPRVLPRILPDFSVASRQNTADTPITFSNLTSGIGEVPVSLTGGDDLATYEWTFAGGTPATSTDSNPTVSYNSAGSFDVTLKVTRPITGTEEISLKEGFIVIE